MNKKIKKDKIIVIAIGIIATCLLVFSMFPSLAEEDNGDSEKIILEEGGEASSINFKVPSKETKVNQDGLLNTYEKSLSDSLRKARNNNFNLGNVVSEEENILETPNSRLYTGSSVDEELQQNLQKQLKELEKNQNHSPTNYSNSNNSSSSRSVASKKEELSYEEKLQIARANRLKNTSYNNVIKKEKRVIETRAAIFRDQFKQPGELVELVLTKSFNYKGKTFKKGTMLYADLNIGQSRVLFDITNIAHIPVNLEVRDIRDGRIGMYSTRAGELWDRYQAEALNDATDNASNEIASSTSTRILSGSLSAISNFFQKKRLKKNEKILLLNDQELIIHIIENDEK